MTFFLPPPPLFGKIPENSGLFVLDVFPKTKTFNLHFFFTQQNNLRKDDILTSNSCPAQA